MDADLNLQVCDIHVCVLSFRAAPTVLSVVDPSLAIIMGYEFIFSEMFWWKQLVSLVMVSQLCQN